jgi:hypothetical protein
LSLSKNKAADGIFKNSLHFCTLVALEFSHVDKCAAHDRLLGCGLCARGPAVLLLQRLRGRWRGRRIARVLPEGGCQAASPLLPGSCCEPLAAARSFANGHSRPIGLPAAGLPVRPGQTGGRSRQFGSASRATLVVARVGSGGAAAVAPGGRSLRGPADRHKWQSIEIAIVRVAELMPPLRL